MRLCPISITHNCYPHSPLNPLCLDPGVEIAANVKAESDSEETEESRGLGGQETGDQEQGAQEKMSYGDPSSGVPGVMDTEDTMGVYRGQTVNQAFSHHR